MTVRRLGHRILYTLTRPPVAPLRQLVIYYAIVGLAVAGLLIALPSAGQLLGVGRLGEIASGVEIDAPSAGRPDFVSWLFDLRLGVALVSALLLMLPVS